MSMNKWGFTARGHPPCIVSPTRRYTGMAYRLASETVQGYDIPSLQRDDTRVSHTVSSTRRYTHREIRGEIHRISVIMHFKNDPRTSLRSQNLTKYITMKVVLHGFVALVKGPGGPINAQIWVKISFQAQNRHSLSQQPHVSKICYWYLWKALEESFQDMQKYLGKY